MIQCRLGDRRIEITLCYIVWKQPNHDSNTFHSHSCVIEIKIYWFYLSLSHRTEKMIIFGDFCLFLLEQVFMVNMAWISAWIEFSRTGFFLGEILTITFLQNMLNIQEVFKNLGFKGSIEQWYSKKESILK